MPAPALLGLPALFSFIGSIFTGFISFVLARYSKRIAVFTLAMLAVLAALTAIFSHFADAINQLALSVPPELAIASMFFPSNTMTCINVILSAEVAALGYRFTMFIIRTKMDMVS